MKYEFEPSELRIGDVIWYLAPHGEKLPHMVEWNDLKWLSENPKDFNEKHEAINLTIDDVEQFGFKCLKFPVFKFIETERMYNFMFFNIFYMHQFQQFYKRITNTELDVTNLFNK